MAKVKFPGSDELRARLAASTTILCRLFHGPPRVPRLCFEKCKHSRENIGGMRVTKLHRATRVPGDDPRVEGRQQLATLARRVRSL